MKILRNTVTAISALALFFLFATAAKAADYQINPTGPSFALNNLVWGTTGANGFNNNYFFSPIANNESVCVYVYSNNPSNTHPFNASLVVSGNANNISPSDGTWQNTATFNSLLSFSSPGLPGAFGASVSGAALVSINLSGSTTLAGSPDTANLKIIQTSGSCTSAQNSYAISSTVASVSPLQSYTDALGQGYSLNTNVTNPAVTSLLLFISNNAFSKTVYPSRLVLSSTATVVLQLVQTSALGAACTGINGSITSMRMSATVVTATVSAWSGGCTGANLPTAFNAGQNVTINLGANTPVTIDLTGYVLPPNNPTFPGLAVECAAGATAVVSSTIYWYEK